MANLNELIANGQICRCLRAKTMFYQGENSQEAPDPSFEAARTYGNLWCSQTQSPLGPDGQAVDIEQCRPSLSCCETA